MTDLAEPRGSDKKHPYLFPPVNAANTSTIFSIVSGSGSGSFTNDWRVCSPRVTATPADFNDAVPSFV
ncbi:MAG: hypothetical protein HQ582_01045 [Planctomycetes bacterium]|nr:hypothetical protein [Planctomycetota bacterium]